MPQSLLAPPRVPKVKCCTSRPRCKRCPLRMLAEGSLPEGYAVKKRRLVDPAGQPVKKGKKSASAKKLKRASLAAAAIRATPGKKSSAKAKKSKKGKNRLGQAA